MSDMVSPLLQWLNANPQLAGVATFLISAAESVAVIGTIVPGSITMTAIGTLAGAGVIPLTETIVYAILGAIFGDSISYWLGHYFKDRLKRSWPFKSNPAILEKGEHFVNKYGVMSVFIGRFVGPVRALVPMVAGMLGMRPLQFTIANVTSAIGWAPVYMMPGILLGAASLELPPDIALHVILVLFLIGLFITLCIWTLYKFIQLLHKQIQQFKQWLWNKLYQSRYFYFVTALLKHHDDAQMPGQLSLALLFIASSCAFIVLALYVKWHGPGTILANQIIYHLFRGMHNNVIYHSMINITFLGQKQVILSAFAIIALWAALSRNWRFSLHVLMLAFASSAAIFILKHSLKIPRPWGIFQNIESYSMPSGHTTLAVTFYIGLAYFLTRSLQSALNKKIIFIFAFLLATSVSTSRLYLGAHWLTDVFASWLVATAIMSVVIISYEREKARYPACRATCIVTLLSLMICFGCYRYVAYEQATVFYARLPAPTKMISTDDWWDVDDHDIPAYRTNLFGFPSDRINIEWAGDIKQITLTLKQAGWQTPPARDWISMLHRVADVSSTQYLPMVSPQYLDKSPELTLTKPLQGKKGLMVIRLWHAYRIIQPANDKVWVGVVAMIPRTYSGLFRKSLVAASDIPALVAAQNKQWEWRLATLAHKRAAPQAILLIRPKN